jgi:hypothetical protein
MTPVKWKYLALPFKAGDVFCRPTCTIVDLAIYPSLCTYSFLRLFLWMSCVPEFCSINPCLTRGFRKANVYRRWRRPDRIELVTNGMTRWSNVRPTYCHTNGDQRTGYKSTKLFLVNQMLMVPSSSLSFVRQETWSFLVLAFWLKSRWYTIRVSR